MYPGPEPKAKAEAKAEPEPKPAATDPAKPAKAPPAEGNTKTDSEPVVEAQPKPVEEKEEPEEALPENVQKKIAKEVARQAKSDRAIAEAVSARKASEDKLSKLTASGSDPAPTTAAAENVEPVEPEYDEPDINKFETLAAWETAKKQAREKYKADRTEWRTKYRDWLKAETSRTVEAELTERITQQEDRRDLARAIKERGPEFIERRKAVADNSTEPFQMALTAMGPGRWDLLADYLGGHLEELKRIEGVFTENPAWGLAELGALEYRLKQEAKTPEPAKAIEPKPAKAEAKPLPDPPKKVGGAATAGAPLFNFAKEPMSKEWKRQFAATLDR